MSRESIKSDSKEMAYRHAEAALMGDSSVSVPSIPRYRSAREYLALAGRLDSAVVEVDALADYVERDADCARHRRSDLLRFVERIRSALVGEKGASQ